MKICSAVVAFSFLLLTLVACGQANQATITLITGLENRSPVKNLMETLANPHRRVLATDGNCLQKNLFAGIKTGNAIDDSDIDTFPINMVTPYGSTTSPEIDSTWLSINATFPPIRIPVARGTTVEFGVVGTIIAAMGADTVDGGCAAIDSSSNLINPNYSVIGHTQALVNSDAEIPINVWVLNATSTPAPGGTTCSGIPGANDDVLGQKCPSRDYYSISCAGCPGAVRFEYAFGRNQSDHVKQMINLTEISSSAGVSIPRMGGIVVSLQNAAGTQYIGNTTIANSAFNSAGVATFPITLTDGNIATLTVVNGPMVSTTTTSASPTASPTATATPDPVVLNGIRDLNGLTTIEWAPLNVASPLDIQWSPDSSAFTSMGTFSAMAGQAGMSFNPPVGGGFPQPGYPVYYRVVKFGDNPSSVLSVTPVGPFSIFPFYSSTVSWVLSSGAVAGIDVQASGVGGLSSGVFSAIGGCTNLTSSPCYPGGGYPPYQVIVYGLSGSNAKLIGRTDTGNSFIVDAVKSASFTVFTIQFTGLSLATGSYHYFLEYKHSLDTGWSSSSSDLGGGPPTGTGTNVTGGNGPLPLGYWGIPNPSASTGSIDFRIVVESSPTLMIGSPYELAASNVITISY